VKRLITLVGGFLFCTAAWGQGDDEGSDVDSVVWMTGTKCTTSIVNYDSLIECRFTFGSKVPQYYHEINARKKQVLITMVHARCGAAMASDSALAVGAGPVGTVHIREDLQNKNQDMKVLLPVLYYVTTATIDCDPIVKEQGLAIRDNGKTIFVGFKWPSRKGRRAQLYDIPRPLYTIGVTTLAAGVAAGAAAGIYYYLKNSNEKKAGTPLEPVLPEHPAP
jgi:hypothetical protein